MVLYFSGTGNSQHVAEQIARKMGEEAISLLPFLRGEQNMPLPSSPMPYVFVCPTYAWQIPHVVRDFLLNTTPEGARDVYFVLTCGGQTANSVGFIEKLCRKKDWNLKGFAEILMPDNYIVMFPPIDRQKAAEQIKAADVAIEEIAQKIANGESFRTCSGNGPLGKLGSSIVNAMFYPLFVSAKGFFATDACIGCQQCAELCPQKTITMQKGRPHWADGCTHCMACICRCPTGAIEYKNKTQDKPRYWFYNYR